MADTANPVVLSPISEVPPETTRTSTIDHAVTPSETSDTVTVRPSTVIIPAKAATQRVAPSMHGYPVSPEKKKLGDEKGIMCIVALLLPPLAVAIVLHAYDNRLRLHTYSWLCIFLCFLAVFPGFLFALFVIFRYAGMRPHPETTPAPFRVIMADGTVVQSVPTESAQ